MNGGGGGPNHPNGRRGVEDDGAEVRILGCTVEFGFHEKMQHELGVPALDPMLSALKRTELLFDGALRFGWYPSRKWGSEAPSEEKMASWGCSIANRAREQLSKPEAWRAGMPG